MLVIVMLTGVVLDQLGFEPRILATLSPLIPATLSPLIPATLSPLIGHRSTVVRTSEGNMYEQ